LIHFTLEEEPEGGDGVQYGGDHASHHGRVDPSSLAVANDEGYKKPAYCNVYCASELQSASVPVLQVGVHTPIPVTSGLPYSLIHSVVLVVVAFPRRYPCPVELKKFILVFENEGKESPAILDGFSEMRRAMRPD
jgi:hypothetical protein